MMILRPGQQNRDDDGDDDNGDGDDAADDDDDVPADAADVAVFANFAMVLLHVCARARGVAEGRGSVICESCAKAGVVAERGGKGQGSAWREVCRTERLAQ